jgi:2-polyprenyl-6-methoxyphenol hydroxylase-like FAD-dependent oxidoreductase
VNDEETSTDVLVVGAGPVGLTVGAELRRHGVECRVVERLADAPQYAKAVGVQPRTVEIWEDMGVVQDALDAAVDMRGQIVFQNGEQVGQLELSLPPAVPYGFVALPQYETEAILGRHLAGLGGHVERGVSLEAFSQDDEGVSAVLASETGPERVRARYLVGCDGAHSVVRHGLELGFEGGRFPEEYMLGDVEVSWSLPPGFGIRAMHTSDGDTDDLLVCIPLPGQGRYRMSMFVPPELAGTGTDHGFASDRPAPTLAHIQAVLDRLAPEPVTARNLRWSSVFRISHRLVDRYSVGRAFVCGDAAHIHPPTGAQGMNTGIQDGYNLAWKLALAIDGVAAAGLLESYDAERRPIGEEVVGRTVRHARSGFEGDSEDPATMMLREAQLLVGYPDSPLVGQDGSFAAGPAPGARAPDVTGLRRNGARYPLRLFELLRGTDHVLLLYADSEQALTCVSRVAEELLARMQGRVRAYAVVDPRVAAGWLPIGVLRDANEGFRRAYGASGACAYLVRPDGYVSYRQQPACPDGIARALERVICV